MSHLRAECQCDWCLVARLCQLGMFNKHDIFHGTFIYIDSCVVLMSRNLFLLYREDFKRHRSTITRPAGCNKSLINFLTDQMIDQVIRHLKNLISFRFALELLSQTYFFLSPGALVCVFNKLLCCFTVVADAL